MAVRVSRERPDGTVAHRTERCCLSGLLTRGAAEPVGVDEKPAQPVFDECQPLRSIYLTEVRYVGVCCRFECWNILGVGPGSGALTAEF